MMPVARARKRAKLESFPCSACNQNCEINSIQCDTCAQWVHAKCESLDTCDLDTIQGDCSFTCSKCIKTMHGEKYNFREGLSRLSEAAEYGIDHLRVLAKRETQLMPPLEIELLHDNSNQLVDYTAMSYLEHSSVSDDYQPIMTTADVNCLFNALSIE